MERICKHGPGSDTTSYKAYRTLEPLASLKHGQLKFQLVSELFGEHY
jgi:hypothetical protein